MIISMFLQNLKVVESYIDLGADNSTSCVQYACSDSKTDPVSFRIKLFCCNSPNFKTSLPEISHFS